jgi:hypothetical protein
VSGCGTSVHGGTVIMVSAAEVCSDHGVDAMGVGGAPVQCIWEAGRPKLASTLEDM